MSIELLDLPRPETRTDPAAAARPVVTRRRKGQGLAAGLALSAVVHLLIFAVFRFGGPVVSGRGAITSVEREPEGMRVVRIRVVADGAAVPADEQDVAIELAPVTPPRLFVPEIVSPPAEAERVPSVAERLTPRYVDPRLFAREEAMPLPMSAEEAALLRLSGMFAALADSMAAESARSERALDWTVRDAEGKRWGVSSDGIHLGGITLPLPQLGSSAAMREQVRRWSELQGQASRFDLETTLDARIAAIRARRDAQRDSARRGGGG